MALVELRQGWCDCGAELMLHVYWPYVKTLQRLVEAGGLQEFDDDDRAAMFNEALETDLAEQDGGEVEMARTMALATGGLFVDMRKEGAVTCPECGAIVVVVARQRVG